MPQFLVSKEDIDKDSASAIISGDEAKHLTSSLRARVGESVLIFDGEGQRWAGVIEGISQGAVAIRTLKELQSSEPLRQVVLVQSLIKGDRWEWLLEKATELGVTKIVPLKAKHSVVEIANAKVEKKISRWRKILLAASKQCERGKIPQITEPVGPDEFFKALGPPTLGETRFVLAERHADEAAYDSGRGDIILAIGPEGGWSEEELVAFTASKFIKLSLGSRILRSETAALAALAKLTN